MKLALFFLAAAASLQATSYTFPTANLFVPPGCATTSSGTMTVYGGGCYLKFALTPTSGSISVQLTVDTTANNGSTSGQMPAIKTVMVAGEGVSNDSVYVTTQLPANNTSGTQITAISGLNSNAMTITIYFLHGDDTQACWTTSVCTTVVQSLQVTGATVAAPTLRPKRCVFFGDSYLLSSFGSSGGATYTNIDFTWGWPFFASAALGCEYMVVAVGSQGYVRTGNGGLPALGSSWNYYQSGSSRTFSGIDYVFLTEGINDHGQTGATITSNVSSLIGAMRTGFGPGAKIFVVPPVNPYPDGGDGTSGSITADIVAGVASAADASTYVAAIPTEFQNVAFTGIGSQTWCSIDNLHLNGGTRAALDGNCQGLIGYSVIVAVQKAIDGVTGTNAVITGNFSLQ